MGKNAPGGPPTGGIIYRRYRRCPHTGKILDAHDYGHVAWPIPIGPPRPPRKRKPRP